MLEIRLLGPVEIVNGDGTVNRLTPKLRTLLAALAFHAGTVVGGEDLIEEIWRDEAPANPVNALQAHVARLRHSLAAPDRAGAVLLSDQGGYRLALATEQSDLLRFRHLRARAGAAPARAEPLLDEALSLWRGPAFSNAGSGPLCGRAAELLNAMRLATIAELMDLRLQAGRSSEVAATLQDLLLDHPHDEALHDLLMLALHRSGRPDQAIAVYNRLHQHLTRTWNTQPGPALQHRLHSILQTT